MDARQWALDNVGRVIAEVERHGLQISWSEAHEHLLSSSALLTLAINRPDDGGVPVEIAGTDDRPAWERMDFAEEVACDFVRQHEKPFFPASPATSATGIAVPWEVAGELVVWLNTILVARLSSIPSDADMAAVGAIAKLTTGLSFRVSDELAWQGEKDAAPREKVEGHPYVLMAAKDVWQAAQVIRDAVVDEDESEERDIFLWDLEVWIVERTRS